MRTQLAITTLIATLLAATTAPAVASPDDCWSNWSQAAATVRNEGLTTLERLSALSTGEIDGKVLRATLCRRDQQFVYRLLVRSPQGHMAVVTVDARTPFAR